MIKKFFIKLRSKFYFIPGVYSIIFTLFSFLIYYVDTNHYESIEKYVPIFFLTSRNIGQDIFIMEIGSLIAMLTITFSIMMVVLTIYASQLSPRTLQDFIENKITQRIMGYFIGILIFSIISLFLIKPDYYTSNIISPAIGIVFFCIAIGIFAYFIHFISKSVQVTLYIQKLVDETSSLIDKKQDIINKDHRISNSSLDNYEDILDKDSYEIKAKNSGFIQYYNEKKLFEISNNYEVIIWCEKQIGEHILEDTTIIKIYDFSEIEDLEKLIEEIYTAIVIGNEINLYEDIGAGTKKLVEIAVRALSPGINDPNTAIFCIEKIGFLLHKLARRQEAKIYINDQGKAKVIVQGVTFEKLLFDHFYQISHYGINDLAILDSILGSLIVMSKQNSYTIKKQIWAFSKYLLSVIDLASYPELEKSYLKQRIYQLSKETQQDLDYSKII